MYKEKKKKIKKKQRSNLRWYLLIHYGQPLHQKKNEKDRNRERERERARNKRVKEIKK